MFSKIFVRSVLIAIVVATVWLLSWTWTTAGLQNLAQRVALSIIEGSILLASLSLLIESFISFVNLEVKRGSWRYRLYGFWLIDLDEDTNQRLPSVNSRTCAMFGARSFALSILTLFTAAILTSLFQIIKEIISFLFNPYVPPVDWLVAGKYTGLIVVGFIIAIFVIQYIEWLNKKLTDTAIVIQTTVWILSASILFSLTMSIINIFAPIDNSPFYLMFFYGMMACLMLAAFVGTVLGLGFGIYKLAGQAAKRYPVLESTWNQVCPVRTINFLDN
jgi:hypothetical protein